MTINHPPSPARRGPTHVRVYVSLWLAALAAIAYLSRTSISVAAETIQEDLGITEGEMGFVMGTFFWTYALTQIPTAWLGQRYGSRLMLTLFALASAAATLQFSLAGSFAVLVLARMLMGVAQAGTFPCATQTISHWYPITERARASGLLAAAMQIGHGIGAAVTGLLIAGVVVGGLTIHGVGWRWTFALFALPGFVWAFGFWIWFRNRPREHHSVNEAEAVLIGGLNAVSHTAADEAAIVREPTPWGKLIASPAMWLICSQQFFRGSGQAFYATWFPTYLQKTRDVSLEDSGWMTAVPVLAMMFAAYIGGAVSDRIYRRTGSLNIARKGVAAVSLLLCAGIVTTAYFVSDPFWAVMTISLGAFCATIAGPCAYSVTIDMGGRHVPAVFSTMNMVGNIGAALFAMAVPYFRKSVEQLASGAEDPVRVSWAAVLLLFAAMFLAAACCWMRLQVRGTVFDADADTDD